MIRFAAIVVFSLFHLATFVLTAGAGEAPSATPYSGDIWNRSTLTGDWPGLRCWLRPNDCLERPLVSNLIIEVPN
jgi:hypothetical protein